MPSSIVAHRCRYSTHSDKISLSRCCRRSWVTRSSRPALRRSVSSSAARWRRSARASRRPAGWLASWRKRVRVNSTVAALSSGSRSFTLRGPSTPGCGSSRSERAHWQAEGSSRMAATAVSRLRAWPSRASRVRRIGTISRARRLAKATAPLPSSARKPVSEASRTRSCSSLDASSRAMKERCCACSVSTFSTLPRKASTGSRLSTRSSA